jgi:hypothetical protein
MLRFLRLVALVIVGAWSLLRGAEEAVGMWVRHSARPRDLTGPSWA